MNPIGTVYLVGAGPGDPGLITVKGLKLIQSADVILYDRLAPPELLAEARPGAEQIDVGKYPGHPRLTQDGINALLIEKAYAYPVVVRLKGGDPFVFGRGGEEALACHLAGVPFVVVPGISSAIAVPAYAGIPVTQRGLTSTFTVFAGHEDPTKSASNIDYDALAKVATSGTLVVLMGVMYLPQIAAKLIEFGVNPTTPAACIEWGTTEQQRVVDGTLATLPELANAAGLSSPTTTVIGAVAGLRTAGLDWYTAQPELVNAL
ncbi:MAG: uroporphyrinogen-III C-methyltransferase [Aggregatilineales bacterium]